MSDAGMFAGVSGAERETTGLFAGISGSVRQILGGGEVFDWLIMGSQEFERNSDNIISTPNQPNFVLLIGSESNSGSMACVNLNQIPMPTSGYVQFTSGNKNGCDFYISYAENGINVYGLNYNPTMFYVIGYKRE